MISSVKPGPTGAKRRNSCNGAALKVPSDNRDELTIDERPFAVGKYVRRLETSDCNDLSIEEREDAIANPLEDACEDVASAAVSYHSGIAVDFAPSDCPSKEGGW